MVCENADSICNVIVWNVVRLGGDKEVANQDKLRGADLQLR